MLKLKITKVLIVSGGDASERRISLMSAKEVKKALEQNNYSVKIFYLRQGFKKLKAQAHFYDVVFPVLHGEEGEGGKLQKFLTKAQIPFVGGSAEGFKKGWYKLSFKRLCGKQKILTAGWERVKSLQDIKTFGFPCVLKSDNGGSSREVVILKNERDLKKSTVKKLMRSGLKLFVERFLQGVEITVGVLGNKALPVIEIVPPKDGWFDYKNKYWDQTQELPFAPSVALKTQKQAQQIALNLHRLLNLGHYSRTDFIISQGKPYVLEVNVIPGMTAGSLFPKAALAAGLDFPALTKKLVTLALAK